MILLQLTRNQKNSRNGDSSFDTWKGQQQHFLQVVSNILVQSSDSNEVKSEQHKKPKGKE